MPVPRRFDRRPPDRDPTRVNDRIRVPQVRLIGPDGEQIGVIDTSEAKKIAAEAELDLVEVAPESKPPVCKVLDYSKYKYELEQKAKAARKHQQQVNVREIKLRPKIATHDYETKKGHVERFLRKKDKVKVTIMFRGREQAHPERGRMLLERLYEDLGELAIVEQQPQQEGRNMHMILGPGKEAIAAAAVKEAPAPGEPAAAADSTAAAKPAADKPAARAKPVTEPTADAEPKAEQAEAAPAPVPAPEAAEEPDESEAAVAAVDEEAKAS